MKARTESENWVQSLRTLIRDSLGTNWQIKPNKGKTKIRIRFNDGSRVEKMLGIDWAKAEAPKILKTVEEIHHLTIKKKVPLDEAVERVKKTRNKALNLAATPNPKRLLNAWEKYENHKVNVVGDVTQATWNQEYGGKPNNGILPPRNKHQGKTYLRLREIKADNANELLLRIGEKFEHGTRGRQIRVQHIAAFLRWATSKQSGFLLPEENWNPPPKNALGEYVGRKSAEKQKKSSAPTVAIEDKNLLELINSLPIDVDKNQKKHRLRDRAMEWDLAIKLSIVYGLRPNEVSHEYLEVKKNKNEFLWCNYCKKAGGGTTKPRRLWPLHPEWEKEWHLLERIKQKDPLPRMKAGAGDAFKNYLRFNDVWKQLKSQHGVVPYSFRHSYSKRAHQIYKLSDTEVAAFMGHSVPVHNSTYAQWSTESMLESSMDRAIKFRDLTAE